MLKSNALAAVPISLFSIVTPSMAANPMAFLCEENCSGGSGALDFAVLVLVLVAAGAAWGFWRVAFAAFSYGGFIALIFLIPLAAIKFYRGEDDAAWGFVIWAVGIAGAIKFGFSVLDAPLKNLDTPSATDTQSVVPLPLPESPVLAAAAATVIIEKNDRAIHGRSPDSASSVEAELEDGEIDTVTLMLPDGHIDINALTIFTEAFGAKVEDRREIKGGLWVLQGQVKERTHYDDMAQILAEAGFKWSEVRFGWYVH